VIGAIPADTPDTIPDPNPIVAIATAPELHVPPLAPSLNVVMAAWHSVVMPAIGVIGFTVKLTLTEHPAEVL